MKKLVLIALTLLSAHSIQAQQWTQINSQTTSNLNGMHFPTATVGYAAGGNTVIKSTDAGLTWHPVTAASLPDHITDVRFISADTGYISGYTSGALSPTGGYIYKTTDGGGSWIPVLQNLVSPLYSIHFSSKDTGYVTGAEAGDGTIMKTVNGGNTWVEVHHVTNGWMTTVFATSGTRCYAVGVDYGASSEPTVWSTTNGVNFSSAIPTLSPNRIFGLFFSDAQHGFITGNGIAGDFLMKSVNGGTSWSTPIPISPSTMTYGPSALYFSGADTGYVGGDGAQIRKTTNGGASWANMAVTYLPNSIHGTLREMQFINPSLAIAVGWDGTILRYSPAPPNPTDPMTATVTPQEKQACEGDKLQVNTTVTNAQGTVSYNWQPTNGLSCNNCANPVITVSTGVNMYTETITDGITTLTKTVTITGNPKPNVTITNSNPVSIKEGETVQLNAVGASSYTWSPATYLNNTQIANPIAKPTADITYTVSGTNGFGCSNQASITIKVQGKTFFIPNAFSPNGDGLNDVFAVGGLSKDGGTAASVNIFNRWGQVVFSQFGKEVQWDGRYNGLPADAGTYFYAIRLSLTNGDTKEFKGDITLIR